MSAVVVLAVPLLPSMSTGWCCFCGRARHVARSGPGVSRAHAPRQGLRRRRLACPPGVVHAGHPVKGQMPPSVCGGGRGGNTHPGHLPSNDPSLPSRWCQLGRTEESKRRRVRMSPDANLDPRRGCPVAERLSLSLQSPANHRSRSSPEGSAVSSLARGVRCSGACRGSRRPPPSIRVSTRPGIARPHRKLPPLGPKTRALSREREGPCPRGLAEEPSLSSHSPPHAMRPVNARIRRTRSFPNESQEPPKPPSPPP